jgi:hypothetical protein
MSVPAKGCPSKDDFTVTQLQVRPIGSRLLSTKTTTLECQFAITVSMMLPKIRRALDVSGEICS